MPHPRSCVALAVTLALTLSIAGCAKKALISKADIPMFPWPPPAASAYDDGIAEVIRVRPGQGTLGDVDKTLREALDACGYTERSYFAVPEGFAVVTRLEQVDADGRPLPVPDRWSSEVAPLREFSMRAYFRTLFTATPGRYRLIVFVVTSEPFSRAGAKVSEPDAKAWLDSGLNRQPKSIAERPYGPDYAISALIYEFVQPDAGEATLTTPSVHTGRTHMQRAGMLAALGR